MIIIHDFRIPAEASKKLSVFGETVQFRADEISYPSIGGHPDIFLCPMETDLIVAPNLPEKYKSLLSKNSVPFVTGETPIGKKYPDTAKYNAVCTENYLIHNFRHTDSSITDRAGNRELIHVDQGYTRCNLLPLKNDNFITSDTGIARVLGRYGIDHLYADPSGILLPDMKNGFFGGACGIYQDKIFIVGSLTKFHEGKKVKEYLKTLNYEIIELYDGPLFDGGSILFI